MCSFSDQNVSYSPLMYATPLSSDGSSLTMIATSAVNTSPFTLLSSSTSFDFGGEDGSELSDKLFKILFKHDTSKFCNLGIGSFLVGVGIMPFGNSPGFVGC